MKTGIVFEGGAFRTVFSCGVMDAFIKKNIYPDYCIGTSAGAAYGVSYISKQYRRNIDILLKYCNDKRYMGMNNMLDKNNRSYYGLEFVYQTIPEELAPFDYKTYDEWKGEFYAAVTNCNTGKAEYMKYSTSDRQNLVLQATCALPFLFPTITIDGVPYLDGGLSDSIPYEEAFRAGCDRLLVVLTREESYRKQTSESTRMLSRAYLKYPNIAEDILKRAKRYNTSVKRLAELEAEKKVIVLRPDNTKGFSRLERDRSKIIKLYNDGFQKGIVNADRIKDFFELD